ncbi:MAG: hypothetical protein V1928_05665 [Parcubacteria group bacterium]
MRKLMNSDNLPIVLVVGAIIFFIIFFVVLSCTHKKNERNFPTPSASDIAIYVADMERMEEQNGRNSGGVVVIGGCGDGIFERPNAARMVNRNDFPVRVRHVIQARAELTQSVFQLEPGERKFFQYVSPVDGFYIHSVKSGALLGWIGRDMCPQ